MTAVAIRVTTPCPAWCVLSGDEHPVDPVDGDRFHASAGRHVEDYPGGHAFEIKMVQADSEGRACVSIDGAGYVDPTQIQHLVQALYAMQRTAATQDYTGTLSGRVRAACARRGLSQQALAGLLGVTLYWVSCRMTMRKPWTEDDVKLLAEALEVEIDELLGVGQWGQRRPLGRS